jgi:hypothetical protein
LLLLKIESRGAGMFAAPESFVQVLRKRKEEIWKALLELESRRQKGEISEEDRLIQEMNLVQELEQLEALLDMQKLRLPG